jgi:hypothetical protein
VSRRIVLSTASFASLPSLVAAAPSDSTVTIDVNGVSKVFDARPLPKGFDQGLEFPRKDISEAVFGPLGTAEFQESWPYTKLDMKRLDESDDSSFYDDPRLVYHIDGGAVAALSNYYSSTIKPGSDILDICSSWVNKTR